MDPMEGIETPARSTWSRGSRNLTPRDQELGAFNKRPSQSSVPGEFHLKVKSEANSSPASLSKVVTLKYNSAKAIMDGVAQAEAASEDRESSTTSSNGFPGLVSPFLFVPTKYWIDLGDPHKLFKVASSPQEIPTWQMPTPERARCGMSLLTSDPLSDRNPTNVRNAFMPVFLAITTRRPYYRLLTSSGRTTSEEWVLLDRPFQEEKARLECARSILQKNFDDIESALVNYTVAMSKWRSQMRHWEVQTIHDEIKAGNTIIFRHRVTKQDLDELDEWLRREEQKEAEGQYDIWYCGVLCLGLSNIFPPVHVLNSVPIKEVIDKRLDRVHAAIVAVEKMIKEIEFKSMPTAPSGQLSTPKPLVDLPDYSSDDEEPTLEEEHLTNMTIWAYERHLHWIPRDQESKKKYRFRTESDVYNFFRIKKLTCADSTGSVGNQGLFQEHIRIPQDLARYPWGFPFHILEESIAAPDPVHHRQLYSETGRTLLRDMEVDYFDSCRSCTVEDPSANWKIPDNGIENW